MIPVCYHSKLNFDHNTVVISMSFNVGSSGSKECQRSLSSPEGQVYQGSLSSPRQGQGLPSSSGGQGQGSLSSLEVYFPWCVSLKLLEGMENEPILQQFSWTNLEWISVAIPLKG